MTPVATHMPFISPRDYSRYAHVLPIFVYVDPVILINKQIQRIYVPRHYCLLFK